MSYTPYVPSELRSHILGYLPPGEAGYGAETMRVSDLELLREARELGIDLAEIIAEERMRRWREAAPTRLFQVLKASQSPANVIDYEDNLEITTNDPNLAGAIRRIGYDVEEQHRPLDDPFAYELVLPEAGDAYYNLRRLFDEQIEPTGNARYLYFRPSRSS